MVQKCVLGVLFVFAWPKCLWYAD